jgi:hypothetical protein
MRLRADQGEAMWARCIVRFDAEVTPPLAGALTDIGAAPGAKGKKRKASPSKTKVSCHHAAVLLSTCGHLFTKQLIDSP